MGIKSLNKRGYPSKAFKAILIKTGGDRVLPLFLRSPAIMSDSPGHELINNFFTGVCGGGADRTGEARKKNTTLIFSQHFPIRYCDCAGEEVL